MTSPLRKNLPTTVSKTPDRGNRADSLRLFLLSLLVFGCLFTFSSSLAAQDQPPARFQKPDAFRYILGVRKNQDSRYGTTGNRPAQFQQEIPRAKAVRQSVGGGVPQDSRGSAPIRVNPIDDPFGDLAGSDEMPARVTGASKPRKLGTLVSAGTRSRLARQETNGTNRQQQSILRRPDNSPVEAKPSGNRTFGSPVVEPAKQIQENTPSPGTVQEADDRQGFQPPVRQQPPADRPESGRPLTLPMRDSVRSAETLQDQDIREQVYELDCQEINGVMLHRSIREIALNMTPEVEKGKVVPQFCTFEGMPMGERNWEPQGFNWTASAACSKPLYFQNIQLERYGHSRGPILQPILSAAHFFGNAAIYPYKSGIHPPNECMYALGYYRPGDCAPWLREPFPISVKGAASQAVSAVGYTGVFR